MKVSKGWNILARDEKLIVGMKCNEEGWNWSNPGWNVKSYSHHRHMLV